MKNPIDQIRANCAPTEFLATIAQMKPFELDATIEKTSPNDIAIMGTWMSSKLRGIGINSTLVHGGLMSYFFRITDRDDRKELFDNLLIDLGTSKSQAYRAMNVFNHFGKIFMAEPTLLEQFCGESLKILAEERTPDPARKAALEQARGKIRISIKVAQNLIRKHGGEVKVTTSKAKPQPAAPVIRKSRKTIWSFVGRVVRLVIEPSNGVKSKIDLSAIITDLEAALVQVRREYAKAINSQSMKKTG